AIVLFAVPMPGRPGRAVRDEFMLLVQRAAALVRRETKRRMLRDGVAVCQAGVRLWLRQCGAGETADSRTGPGPGLESEAARVQSVRRHRNEPIVGAVRLLERLGDAAGQFDDAEPRSVQSAGDHRFRRAGRRFASAGPVAEFDAD